MKPFTCAALLLAGTAIATPAMASTASADGQPERDYLPTDIVVKGERADDYGTDDGSTATKTPTPLIDVPQAVSFITEDQLEDQAVHQLGDALRYVPGISMETGEGHRDEVFIRGQETTADFYIDGLRDDAQYYRSLYNIERVEVLKGANALIFGRGAGGGAINRVAKRAEFQSAVSGEASVDTFGAFALLADVNQPVSDSLALRLNATYEEFDNDRDFYEGRFIGVSPTLTAALGADTTLYASYTYDNDERVTDRGLPSFNNRPLTGYDSTFFGDPDFNFAESEVHIGRVRLEHDFNGGLSANASVQYADYDKVYANIVPSRIPEDMPGFIQLGGYRDYTDRENLIGQANLVWEADFGTIGSTLLVGMEASSQDTQNGRDTVSFDDGDPDTIDGLTPLAEEIFVPAYTITTGARSRDSQLSTLSFYAQEQLQIGEYVELVGGIRWDRFDLETLNVVSGEEGDRVDEKFSPRAGLIVKPTPDLSLYASYAESFLPQAGDQFLLLPEADAAFEPEKFTSYELGAKWAPLDNVLVSAAIFRLERSNIQSRNELDEVVLAGKSRAEGFEIGAVGEVTDFWKANLGYTYLDGELLNDNAFGDAGQRLQQLPRHSISAWNRFDFTDKIGFGLGVIHQSEQFASFSNDVVLPAYWRVDAAAFYTVSDRLSLQVNIENLFDETYYPSAHGDNNIQPADPFSARFGVRFEL